MHCTTKITDDLTYIGASDGRIGLFENVYPVEGMSYNSYLLTDQKTVLFDTADNAVGNRFLQNLSAALNGRKLDYIVVHHMEPDHSALLQTVMNLHPDATLVCSAKAGAMMTQFGLSSPSNQLIVKQGDTLCTGRHTLSFLMAPMVHWPEVMVSYDNTNGTLFSADAFGTFGSVADLCAENTPLAALVPEARRYYCNIVGKYGAQVSGLLNKAAGLNLQRICPLHGPILSEYAPSMLEKYQLWSTYTPESQSVAIFYGSIYRHTANATELLGAALLREGVKITVFDVSKTHPSYLVAEAFRASHLVFAAPTYNNGVFTTMETLLREIAAHNLQKRTVSFIENGSWAPAAAEKMKQLLACCKFDIVGETITIRSAVKQENAAQLVQLAKDIAGIM